MPPNNYVDWLLLFHSSCKLFLAAPAGSEDRACDELIAKSWQGYISEVQLRIEPPLVDLTSVGTQQQLLFALNNVYFLWRNKIWNSKRYQLIENIHQKLNRIYKKHLIDQKKENKPHKNS